MKEKIGNLPGYLAFRLLNIPQYALVNSLIFLVFQNDSDINCMNDYIKVKVEFVSSTVLAIYKSIKEKNVFCLVPTKSKTKYVFTNCIKMPRKHNTCTHSLIKLLVLLDLQFDKV